MTPDTTIGTLLLFAPAALLAVTFFRSFGSLRSVGTQSERAGSIRQAVPTAVLALVVLTGFFLVFGPAPFGLPLGETLGFAAVAAGSVAAGGLAVYPLVGVLTSDGPTLADSAQSEAPLFTLGVFGGLGLLLAALLLQTVAGQPRAARAPRTRTRGRRCYRGRYRRTDDAEGTIPPTMTEETRLQTCRPAGFTALVGLHVAVTGTSFAVLGVSIANEGSLSWPIVMQAYVPLGAELGGIMPAIVGTVWLVIGATLFAVPLGVGAAVFLTEYAEQGQFTALVEIATNALWSTPSIVFGLFGAAFLIPRLGGDESLLAGMLVPGSCSCRWCLSPRGSRSRPSPTSIVTPASAGCDPVGDHQECRPAGGDAGRHHRCHPRRRPHRRRDCSAHSRPRVDAERDGCRRCHRRLPLRIGAAVHRQRRLLTASASLPTQVWAVIAAGVSGSPQMGWATAFILLIG